ncbi:MAG: AEC family transporter [Parasporobacterium sp.]|nr:AEC family transporter [Parasporobacterium sp.]
MYVVVSSVIILFALIFLGFYIGKRRYVNKEAAPDFSSLVLNVTMPATVFLAIVDQQGSGLMHEGIFVIPGVALLHLLMFLIGLIGVKVMRVPDEDKGNWLYTALLSNNGFMGFPLALAIYGTRGLFMMALCNVITNLLIFSVGIKLVTLNIKTKEKLSIRKMLLNNINIAVVIGFIFYGLNIPLPEILSDMLGYIANITSGLSMIVVGLSLSRLPFKAVFEDKKMFVLAAIRLLIIPLVTILIIKILPFEIDKVMAGTLVLTAALPSSAAQSMIAEQYKANTGAAARCVFITTLFSVVTVPLVMLVYGV